MRCSLGPPTRTLNRRRFTHSAPATAFARDCSRGVGTPVCFWKRCGCEFGNSAPPSSAPLGLINSSSFVESASYNSLIEEPTVRNAIALDKLGALVEGRHENPFEILGPHEVEASGRRAMAVRAVLPNSTKAWVVDQARSKSLPMRRIHPAGLFEAICPMPEKSTGGTYM